MQQPTTWDKSAPGRLSTKPRTVEALVKHAKSLTHDFLGEPERAFAIGEGMEPLAETMPLSGLLDAVESAVQEIGGQA